MLIRNLVNMIILLAILCKVSQAYGNSKSTDWSQVVAQFPPGVWNGSCDIETLRFLPLKCVQALSENATASEYLACNIISAPNTLGIFPFGMYPTSMPLTVQMTQVTSLTTTRIFSDCALAQMIASGCFLFRALTDEAEYTISEYSTADEYVSQVSKTYGLDISASGSYGPISARASYSHQSKQTSTQSSSSKVSGCSQSWTNAVGTLSMATCAIGTSMEQFLSPAYVEKWNSISTMALNELSGSQVFDELMMDGFYVPISFDYAVSYSASVTSTYDVSSTSTSSQMSTAISAGLDVSFFGAKISLSTSMSNSIDQSASSMQISSHSTGIDAAYGECDFGKLATSSGNWSSILSSCANAVANNLESLQQPARVSRGGFLNIIEILTNSGVQVPTDLEDAMNSYFAYCECQNPWETAYNPGSNGFQCYLGNGVPSVYAYCSANFACTSAFFYQRDGAEGACVASQ